ncbi:MAG TPA: hypothetical protein VFU07_00755 [Candidatus Lumbricidophila sp.]|nr:hypothetical protein [Candidatus Lumbricidophila sp.]
MNTDTPTWPTQRDLVRVHHRTTQRIHAETKRRAHVVTASVAGAILVSIGATAGAIVVIANQDAIKHSTYCYSADSTASASVQAVNNNTLSAAHATEVCALFWINGSLTWGESHQPDPAVNHAVPALEACLRPDEIIGVFPRQDNQASAGYCEHLGLRPAP